MEIPRELYGTLTNLWNDLEPENVEVLENLLMLPALQRIDVLPYLAVDSTYYNQITPLILLTRLT